MPKLRKAFLHKSGDFSFIVTEIASGRVHYIINEHKFECPPRYAFMTPEQFQRVLDTGCYVEYKEV